MAAAGRARLTPNPVARWMAIGVVAIFLAATLHTYTLYDETADEGQHLAVGMEWFFHHSSDLDRLTPPLAPAVTAVGPMLIGVRPPQVANLWTEYDAQAVGEQLLAGPHLRRTLYAARASTLVFFFLTVGWLWYRVRDWMSEAWAGVAVAVFCLCPSILTHGSLANTDIATMAMFVWALDRLWVLGQRPTWRNAAVAGGVVALGFLTKFTIGPFLAVSVMVLFALSHVGLRGEESRLRWVGLRKIGLAALVFVFVVWGAYFFSVGPISDSARGEAKFAARMEPHPVLGRVALELTSHMPAPVLWKGVRSVKAISGVHTDAGVYFFGNVRYGKMRYFFPVMFAVKMPIPFVLLTLAGAVFAAMLLWHRREPYLVLVVAGIVGPFAIGIATTVHAGLRHILSVVPFCSVLVVLALRAMWQAQRGRLAWRALAVALVCWQAVEFGTSLRDPLPWFNEFAGRNGDWIGGGTDYEYSQNLKMLGETLRVLHASPVSFLYSPAWKPEREGIVARPLQPGVVTRGWIAVPGYTVLSDPQFTWLHAYTPVARSGTMNIYYVP